jgi:FkbM family methyltransferase
MIKIKILYETLLDTKVISGGKVSFIFYFSLTHFLSFVRSRFGFCKKVSFWLLNNVKKEFHIKNSIGHFIVKPFNDSFTISAKYFENELMKWVDGKNRGGVFVDIGANIGRYSIMAINEFNFKKVIAIEANPVTFAHLNKNIEANNISNKIVLCLTAVGSKEGSMNFVTDGSHLGGGRVVDSAYQTSGEWDKKIEVNVLRLDDILTDKGIKAEEIDFIKMDVEGYERDVISGSNKTLSYLKKGTCMMIEISPENKDMVGIIEKYGFKLIDNSNCDYLFCKS